MLPDRDEIALRMLAALATVNGDSNLNIVDAAEQEDRAFIARRLVSCAYTLADELLAAPRRGREDRCPRCRAPLVPPEKRP